MSASRGFARPKSALPHFALARHTLPPTHPSHRPGRRLAEMNPQAIRIFHHLDDVGFTPQLELPAVTIGLIRKFLPLLEKHVTNQSVDIDMLPA
ncbi:hypothetical protein WA1_06255 [Scytonema hofmannii PCC 7110]|uniref:Uncharacterized protein n=1 Tax=Scytonema hofmannii PCC 7110 TaxID=128403 RepID=A0A139WSK5_9CYAN|nr:hypothetical protein WA1_06255 [Scytonema hofmannii PCC 7110]